MSESSTQLNIFGVDGPLLRILPRAGATIRNPDTRLPVLRSDAGGYYLEMMIEGDPDEESEVEMVR